MKTTAQLYSLSFLNAKTYLFAALFIAGNIVLPQLCHFIPNGGLILLPIYFFTLIAAYKYGIVAGLLTAILSPTINNLLFGMPTVEILPIILVKSSLLAIAAALIAKRFNKISLLYLALTILAYQIIGTIFEWIMIKNFFIAVQDFRLGVSGMLIQIFGGYALLKAISKT